MKIGIVVLCTNAYFPLGIRFAKRFAQFYRGTAEVIEYGHMYNNEVYIRAQDGTETHWVAEWCDIITKVEDR